MFFSLYSISCSELFVYLTIYGGLWASVNANELCQEHALHITDDHHMQMSPKEISLSLTFVNLTQYLTLVWLTQTLIFTKRVINEAINEVEIFQQISFNVCLTHPSNRPLVLDWFSSASLGMLCEP